MIVSLMYYVLYPLTRLINSVSELWRKAPSVYINGKELWDGGGSPSRSLTTQQTSLSLQWLGTGETASDPNPLNTERETAQGMVEEEPLLEGREVVGETEERQQKELNEEMMHVSQMEPKAASVNVTEAFTDVKEEQACVGAMREREQSEVERSLERLEEIQEMALVIKLSASETPSAIGSTVTCTTLAPAITESALAKSVKGSDLHAKTDSHYSSEEDEKASAKSKQGTHSSACCSDIFLGVQCDTGHEATLGIGSPVFDLGALLADTQHVHLPTEPIAWHFPVGVGLSEMFHSPFLQFPGTSYYPVFEDNNSIEVMWRVWEDLGETQHDNRLSSEVCADPGSVFEFSVMSYNILAQDLLEANRELYTHCTDEVLAWDKRLCTILKELQIWEPDVLCLQEVQEDHFLEQMYPALTEMGYFCIYKRRTGTKTDGCAVCYHSDRFTQLSVNLVEFRQSDCDLLDRDNVGIVLLLQPIAGQGKEFGPICVANTHLLFNPRRGDIKLAQLAIVFAEIDIMVKKCKSEGKNCDVILCGDFNALPNTPLWEFVTTGQLFYHGLPTWMVSGQMDLSYKFYHRRLFAPLWPSSLGINDKCQYMANSVTQAKVSEKLKYSHDFLRQLRYCPAACVRPVDLEFIPGVTDNIPCLEEDQLCHAGVRHSLCHTLNLTSAYSHIHLASQNCLVTTLNSEGGAMVDYIFYSDWKNCSGNRQVRDGGLKLLGRLSLLSEVDLWSLKGLPNEIFPSDHLSLLVKFQLR